MLQGVRLRRAREHPPWARGGGFETVADDSLDTASRKNASLFGDFVRRTDMHAAADAGVLALRILADADHVDVGWTSVGKRRSETRQEPHRAEVHVLIEPLAERQ